MRISIFIAIFVILFLLDAWTTIYLVRNFPGGMELNPYVDITNFTTLLFSPGHIVVVVVLIFCFVYSEKNLQLYAGLLRLRALKLMAFFYPIYFIFSKSLAVLNNTMPLIGYSTPVAYLRRSFDFLTDDPFSQLVLLEIALALCLAPLIIYLSNRIYLR